MMNDSKYWPEIESKVKEYAGDNVCYNSSRAHSLELLVRGGWRMDPKAKAEVLRQTSI